MRFLLAIPVAIAVAACAPAGTPTTSPTPAPPPMVGGAPLNWHLLDAADGVPGISLLRAERELLAGKQPKRTVVVAVIDNGVDTSHAELRPHLWANSKEIPGNGRDDDGNGYADDVRGWNLIGGRDGKNVEHDTFEVTRLAAQCTTAPDSVPPPYRQRCAELEKDFVLRRSEAEQAMAQIQQLEGIHAAIQPLLRRAARTDSLTVANVTSIVPANDTVRQARTMFLQLASAGLTPAEIEDAKKTYASQVRYGYNRSYNPRSIVGDYYPDTVVRRYGNTDVTGSDPLHGTHVAGIIGALRDGKGATGIAQSVRIMALRTVPDGDERDKDVALAIRYAADNGAHIINMSFGKAYSPYKAQVDAAVRYADSKGVLMVHAAGNEGSDAGVSPSFPTPIYADGGRAVNWIEVAASSWKKGDSLVASFSNYGRSIVDIFAPGVDIYSTVPGGGYKKEEGTSMASPVVAGVAALVMSYYPNLTATDVKKVILESATKFGNQLVEQPGKPGEGQLKFGDMSASGGIVNAYNALKLAEQMSASKP